MAGIKRNDPYLQKQSGRVGAAVAGNEKGTSVSSKSTHRGDKRAVETALPLTGDLSVVFLCPLPLCERFSGYL